MSALSAYARRHFSAKTATVILAAALTGTSSAQQVPPVAAKLHETCMSFDGDTSRRVNKYDEPLGMIVNQLKSWSGWPALREQMKAANIPLDGLCPSTRAPGRIVPYPQARGFALNIVDPETEQPVTPEKFVTMLNDEEYTIAPAIITYATTLVASPGNDPLFDGEMDLDTVIILKTALAAQIMSNNIMMATEAAAKDNRTVDLNSIYRQMPALVADINDLHALTLAAKAQNRSLTEAERYAFRDKMFTQMLKNPNMRAGLAQKTGPDMANIIVAKMVGDASTGKAPVAPVFKALNQQELAEKLKRFSGNMAASEALKSYKAYWSAHPEQDGARGVEEVLKGIPAQVIEQLRQGGHLPPGASAPKTLKP